MHQLLKWWYFTVMGWKIEGAFPYHLKKSVVIVAPHTHWADFFLGVSFRKLLHLEFVRFLGKKELFVPPFSWVLRSMGGSPVDRSKNNNMVDQVVDTELLADMVVEDMVPEGQVDMVVDLMDIKMSVAYRPRT